MKKYILKRLLLSIPVLLGITIITFAVIHLTPGGFTAVNMQMDPRVSPDSVERMKQLYGLNDPIHVRYFNWISRLIVLDFGESFIDQRPVISMIAERLPATLLLNITSLFLVFILGTLAGVYCAVHRGKKADKIITAVSFAVYSVPSFWMALIFMMFFGVILRVLPVSGMTSFSHEYMNPIQKAADILYHMILPVTVTSLGGIAYMSRYVKTGMTESLSRDYIRSARAMGIPENKVIYVMALKNSMMPVVTLLGLSLPGLIGGSFIFESIFAWPGMGRLAYDAAMRFDYPVIMGVVTIGAVLTLIGNLLADITYALIDPRVRYE